MRDDDQIYDQFDIDQITDSIIDYLMPHIKIAIQKALEKQFPKVFEPNDDDLSVIQFLEGRKEVMVSDIAANVFHLDPKSTSAQRRATNALMRIGWSRAKKDWKGRRYFKPSNHNK